MAEGTVNTASFIALNFLVLNPLNYSPTFQRPLCLPKTARPTAQTLFPHPVLRQKHYPNRYNITNTARVLAPSTYRHTIPRLYHPPPFLIHPSNPLKAFYDPHHRWIKNVDL